MIHSCVHSVRNHDHGSVAVSVRDFTWVHTDECSRFGTVAGSSLDFCRTCLIVTRARSRSRTMMSYWLDGWRCQEGPKLQLECGVGFFLGPCLGNPDVLNNAIDCPGGIEDLGSTQKNAPCNCNMGELALLSGCWQDGDKFELVARGLWHWK